MKLGYSITGAVVALGMSLAVQTASAGSMAQNALALHAQPGSDITLVRGPGGGWSGGGFGLGGGFGYGGIGHGFALGRSHAMGRAYGYSRSFRPRRGFGYGGWGYGGWGYDCAWPYDPYYCNY